MGFAIPLPTTGGIYASADAARVGGGLYHAVVEALCTLAMDMAPQVWKAGRSALEAAHVEMVFIGQRPPTAGLSSLRPTQSSTQSLPPAPSGSASAMSSFLPKSWQSKSWRSFSQSAVRPISAVSIGGSSGASSPTDGPSIMMDIPRTLNHPPPFVLRMVCMVPRYCVTSVIKAPNANLHLLFIFLQLPDSGDLEGTVHRGSEVRPVAHIHNRLGPSQVYLTSCKQYRWASLPPLALEERGPSWLRPVSPAKIQERLQVRDEGIAKCGAVAAGAVRMREQVVSVNVAAERTTALLLEAFKPRLVTADGDGTIRVTDYAYSSVLNQFSVSSGKLQ